MSAQHLVELNQVRERSEDKWKHYFSRLVLLDKLTAVSTLADIICRSLETLTWVAGCTKGNRVISWRRRKRGSRNFKMGQVAGG